MTDELTPDKAHFQDPADIEDEHVYAFLMDYYLHQDQLSWGRTEALGVVEIATLAAAFAKEGWIAVGSLFVGTVVIFLIWRLVQRDWDIRDQFLTSALDPVHMPRGIRMTYKPKYPWWRGTTILRVIIYLLVFTNILLAAAFYFGFPAWLPLPSASVSANRVIRIELPSQQTLSFPVESDRNYTIEIEAGKLRFSATK